jgi:adenylyltransferase/sulfurtransferase
VTTEATRPDGVVIKEISPQELRQRMDAGEDLVLVDVREPFETVLADLPEYERLHIPVKEIPLVDGELDHTREIVAYCRSGLRSAWAVERLMEKGFQRVMNLKGGLQAWRAQVDPTLPTY